MILSYPFNIGPTGLSITDEGVDSQLSMLFNTHPGVRLFYPDYGISVLGLEQELLHDGQSPDRTMFVVSVSGKMAKYIPGVLLSNMSFSQGDNENDLDVSINYIYQGDAEEFVWQPTSSLA